MLAIRRPGGRAGVLEVPRGHLDRRSAFDRKNEDVVVAEVEIAHPVLPVLEAVLHDGGIRPLGAGRRFRGRGELRRRVRHQHVEREPLAVGRPAHPAGRFEKLGEGGRLPGIHPAKLDLAVRGVGDSGAVGGPARRPAGAQAAVPGAVGVHDPQFGPLPVAHDVHRGADIDDLAAIRRDLRVGRELELKDVHRLEPGRGLGLARDRDRHEDEGGGEEEVGSGYSGHLSTLGFGVKGGTRQSTKAGRLHSRGITLRTTSGTSRTRPPGWRPSRSTGSAGGSCCGTLRAPGPPRCRCRGT